MTVAEFAARMAMSEWQVRRRIRAERIRAIDISITGVKPEYRISEAEFERYAAEGSATTSAA